MTDITDAKHAAAELKENERILQTMNRLSPVGIFRVSLDGNAIYFNEKWLQIAGRKLDECVGKAWANVLHPDDRERVIADWTENSANLSDYAGEFRMRTPQGKTNWVYAQATPEYDADGTVSEYFGAVTDITDRMKAEHEMVKAVKNAETANRAKSDFLSSMSHELRTPLNAILGYSQLLEQNAGGPLNDIQLSFVKEILSSGHHMLELINEVLDLAKIESGDVDVDIIEHELPPLIGSCLRMVEAAAAENNIAIINYVSGDKVPSVRVDKLRFRQTLLNLLSNAIKYNDPGGKVILAWEKRKNGLLRITVSDTGPGIAEEYQDRVFEPFDRLGAENSAVLGTGVGLSVSKELVERMGGNIGFESSAGAGSTFWIDVLTSTAATPVTTPAKSELDASLVAEASSQATTSPSGHPPEPAQL